MERGKTVLNSSRYKQNINKNMKNRNYVRLTEDELLAKIQKSASGPIYTWDEVKKYSREAKNLGIISDAEFYKFLECKRDGVKYFSKQEESDDSTEEKE